MDLTVLFLCALVLVGSAERHPWSKLEGDLASEPEVELLQEVDESYRLPLTSVPTHYNLHLRTAIHENDRMFQGTVQIFFNLLEHTDLITIHNRQLSIWKITLYTVENEGEAPVRFGNPEFETDSRTEHLIIKCCVVQPPGSYMLEIEYSGVLQNNNNMGFFASSYLADDGSIHYLASSKFEPTHARSAFPCYDEPSLKATFTLSITHYKDYRAVANMPQEGDTIPDDNLDYVTTTFQKSPKMSTYLLAFAVSDFVYRNSGIQTVLVRSNLYAETEYPLKVGTDILNALGEYTGIEYTKYMPKMTQIAIPDRGTGAMENWGLVAYGEPVLLFNPVINTYRNKKTVTTIIAHEFAHQWFGNLVSPHWWDYIWLNEGFATLYEYYAAQLSYPEDRYWDLWNVEVVHNAFSVDARESSRPMTWNAATPGEIANLFDTIAYSKAGSVLNMFRIIFHDDNWREGLLSYLLSRETDDATADHLYEGLQTAIAGKDVFPTSFTVKQLMDSWTTEPGFPLLTIRRDYNNKAIFISQERFLGDKRLPSEHIYHIPYNYAVKSTADFENLQFDWLSSKTAKLATEAAADEWIIFNKQQTGYYRVNYDTQNWQLIISALKQNPTSIHVQNRAQLINDIYNLARADRVDMALSLELMTYLKLETSYPPWAAASTVLTYFNQKLRGTDYHIQFLNFVNEIITPVYSTISVDSYPVDESLIDKYLRQTISTWACRIGNQDCLSRTEDTLKRVVESNVEPLPDIASVIYCYGLKNASATEFIWLYERLLAAKNPAVRSLLIDSLGCSENKEYLKSFLMTATANGEIFNFLESERTRIVAAVYSGGQAGIDALVEYLMDDKMIDEFIERLGVGTLNNALANIAARVNNNGEAQVLNQLLEKLGDRVAPSVVDSAKTVVANNLAWFDSLEGLISLEFFEKYS